MKNIYIASAYRGDVEYNVQMAKQYCAYAVSMGVIPICPHIYFTNFLDDNNKNERQLGLNMGLQLLRICSEIWVFGEITEGMQQEIKEAEKLGIPVAYKDWSDEICISTLTT